MPQIWEYCPKNNPGRYINNLNWFHHPEIESILVSNDGIVLQECIISIDIKIQIIAQRENISIIYF